MQVAETFPFSIDSILGSKSKSKEYPWSYDYVTAPAYPNAAGEHSAYSQPGYSGYSGYYAAPAPAPLVPLHYEAVYSAAYGHPGYGGYAAGYGQFNYPQVTDLSAYACGVQQHNLVPAAAPAISSSELRYLAQIISRRKRHRVRTVFTDSQTEELELLFGRTDYPAPAARDCLARKVGLSEETIRVWFKNRRARRKRQGLKPKSRKTAHKMTKSDDQSSEPGKELTV